MATSARRAMAGKLWCKLGDDGDNPTYIFNERGVRFRILRDGGRGI